MLYIIFDNNMPMYYVGYKSKDVSQTLGYCINGDIDEICMFCGVTIYFDREQSVLVGNDEVPYILQKYAAFVRIGTLNQCIKYRAKEINRLHTDLTRIKAEKNRLYRFLAMRG